MYILVCIFIFLVAYFDVSYEKQNRRTLLASVFFVLFFISATRALSVGADTKNYYSAYEQIRDMSLSQLFKSDIYNSTHSYVMNYEWGLRILFFIVSSFLPFGNGQVGLAIMSAITCFFLYKAVIQQSQSPWTSVWIYVTFGFWQTSMNMAQNAMTIAIMLYAVKFINNGDVKKWCITIVLTSTLHQSAIFFLPVYWLCQYQFNLKRLMFAIGIVLFISNFIVTLSPYIIKWLPANYVVYMSVETGMKNGQIYVLFAHLCIVLMCILLTIRILPPANRHIFIVFNTLWFTFLFIEIAFYMLGISFRGLVRIGTIAAQGMIFYSSFASKKV